VPALVETQTEMVYLTAWRTLANKAILDSRFPEADAETLARGEGGWRGPKGQSLRPEEPKWGVEFLGRAASPLPTS